MVQVDVVIPTHNRFDLTLAAARSVQEQSFGDWALWIIDDGSSDGSGVQLADALADDGRIHVLARPHEGSQAARSFGVESGTSPWVALLDSDDVWLAEKLERQLAISDGADLVLCWHEWFRPDGSVRSTSRPRADQPISPLLTNNVSTPLIRRSFLERHGGAGTPPGLGPVPSCDNIELYLRVLPAARVAIVPSVLTRCRDHSGTRNSDSNATLAGAHELDAIVSYHIGMLREWPHEHAVLQAQVGARMLAAGERQHGYRRLFDALRIAPPHDRTKLVRKYLPFAVKSAFSAHQR